MTHVLLVFSSNIKENVSRRCTIIRCIMLISQMLCKFPNILRIAYLVVIVITHIDNSARIKIGQSLGCLRPFYKHRECELFSTGRFSASWWYHQIYLNLMSMTQLSSRPSAYVDVFPVAIVLMLHTHSNSAFICSSLINYVQQQVRGCLPST